MLIISLLRTLVVAISYTRATWLFWVLTILTLHRLALGFFISRLLLVNLLHIIQIYLILKLLVLNYIVLEISHFALKHILKANASWTERGLVFLAMVRNMFQAHHLLMA